jgi:hypothetical protein
MGEAKRRKATEDKAMAEAAVAKDARHMGRGLANLGMPAAAHTFAEIDKLPGKAMEGAGVFLTIATRDDLSEAAARAAGAAFRNIRKKQPEAPIMLNILGYDDDPRELYEFPEVCEYLLWFAETAGLKDWRAAMEVPWLHVGWGIILLVACGVYDGQDHPFVLQFPPKATRQ